MNDIRKERLMISITTLAGLSCILQNYFGGWEFWMPAVVFIGAVILWWLHLSQRADMNVRIGIYYTYAAFLLFYHGIHDTSLFDISVSVVLFMVTFTMADRIWMLNLILAEFMAVMALQFWFLVRNGATDMPAFEIMRIVYHVGTVFVMYIFSRITVNNRVAERERIRKWRESVSENDHDMEDFLSNISHELRTPVNVISGMTMLLQKEGVRKELTSIGEAGVRLAHQIEDIQDYTEIKRGELHLENENYMCLSLINDVVENFRAEDRKQDLELIVDIAPDMPTLMKGDIRKLHKLFRHLLENAVKFTHRGGILIRMFTITQEYGVNLTIEVEDTGIGMTRADMARVSKGMYQANKKRNRSTGGIGIGLPIVYGFVRRMGGFVNITSTKGEGTKVRISIPQEVVDPAPCLSVKEGAGEIIFFIRPEKFAVPAVREFYANMAVELATGLKVRLYSADERREVERLLADRPVTHLFTCEEEYEENRDLLDGLSKKGCRVVVFSDRGVTPSPDAGITVLPKPLYAFPVVRIINGESGAGGFHEDDRKMRLTDVRALVVDDEPMNLVVATGLFREYRMLTDTAESGKEAIKEFENGEYDVIFMDHMMPEMDGVEAAKRIRQAAEASGRRPAIVALTANALSGAREMFMKEGFDGFIAKPIDIAEFERVMKNVLPEEMISYEGRAEE